MIYTLQKGTGSMHIIKAVMPHRAVRVLNKQYMWIHVVYMDFLQAFSKIISQVKNPKNS